MLILPKVSPMQISSYNTKTCAVAKSAIKMSVMFWFRINFKYWQSWQLRVRGKCPGLKWNRSGRVWVRSLFRARKQSLFLSWRQSSATVPFPLPTPAPVLNPFVCGPFKITFKLQLFCLFRFISCQIFHLMSQIYNRKTPYKQNPNKKSPQKSL